MKVGIGFDVGYYPELLRESTAIQDDDDPGLIVFGALDEPTGDLPTALNKDLPCPVHLVDVRSAEMIKYTSNDWQAVKVTFANKIGNIAKGCGLDGRQVMRILCSDRKMSMSRYFMRPGFAFGGSCLPKDVRALRSIASDIDVASPLLDAVLVAHAEQISRAENMVLASGATSVGLVGISFKPGIGKRDALARSLRLIAQEAPSRRDIVLFVDGDSCVPENSVVETAPSFTTPAMGAVTTDEKVEIRATDLALFRDWFALRFNKRQVMMCAMGRSDWVLTLTGRMSVVRADLATNSGFIQQVQSDSIDHWRLGRVNFLTGDDKSTWFWLLKNGYLWAICLMSPRCRWKVGRCRGLWTLPSP